MRRNGTTWTWDKGATLFVPWVVLFSVFVGLPASPRALPINDVPLLVEACSMPVSTVPGSGEPLPEPSDPDAEPSMRIGTTSSLPPMTVKSFVVELRCPGFAPLPEKPPQI